VDVGFKESQLMKKLGLAVVFRIIIMSLN